MDEKTMTEERELGWEDEISRDSDFVLLTPGTYEFWVDSFERARYNGGAKLPACNKAIVTIKIINDERKTATIKHNFFLHTKTENLICAFYTALGMRQKGERLKMNWPGIVGKSGICKVSQREYTTDQGETRYANQIDEFLSPAEPQKKWENGKF